MFLSACSGIYKSENFGYEFRRCRAYHRRRGHPLPCAWTRRTAIRSTPEPPRACTRRRTAARLDAHHRADVIVNDVYVDPAIRSTVIGDGSQRCARKRRRRNGIRGNRTPGSRSGRLRPACPMRRPRRRCMPGSSTISATAGSSSAAIWAGHGSSKAKPARWRRICSCPERGRRPAGRGSDGIFRWDGSAWVAADALAVAPAPPRSRKRRMGARRRSCAPGRSRAAVDPPKLGGRVAALSTAGDTWFVVTTQGVFRSADREHRGRRSDRNLFGGSRLLTIARTETRVFIGRREA